MAGYLCPMPLASSLLTAQRHPFLANRPLYAAQRHLFFANRPLSDAEWRFCLR